MHRPGNWRVVRDCCIGGLCEACFKRPADQPRPARIVQVDKCSERHAQITAASWLRYNVKVEKVV